MLTATQAECCCGSEHEWEIIIIHSPLIIDVSDIHDRNNNACEAQTYSTATHQ